MGDQAGEEAPFPLTDVDKWVLSLTDEEFKYHNWEELKEIIGEHQHRSCTEARVFCADRSSQPPTISRSSNGSLQTCADT